MQSANNDEMYTIFKDRYMQIITLINEEKVLQAEEQIVRLQADMYKYLQSPDVNNPSCVNLYSEMQNANVVRGTMRDSALIKTFLNGLDNDQGWMTTQESEGVRTMFKHDNNSPIYSIKMEGIIQQSLMNVFSVIYEIDLYPLCFTSVKDVRILGELPGCKRLCYNRIGMPGPLSDRDACVYGIGVNLFKERNGLALLLRSLTPEDGIAQLPAVPRHTSRVEVSLGGFLLTPTPEGFTRVKMLCHSDPKMPVVPNWLFNLATKKLSLVFFNTLRQQVNACASGAAPQYRMRQNTNPVYSLVRNLIEEGTRTATAIPSATINTYVAPAVQSVLSTSQTSIPPPPTYISTTNIQAKPILVPVQSTFGVATR